MIEVFLMPLFQNSRFYFNFNWSTMAFRKLFRKKGKFIHEYHSAAIVVQQQALKATKTS